MVCSWRFESDYYHCFAFLNVQVFTALFNRSHVPVRRPLAAPAITIGITITHSVFYVLDENIFLHCPHLSNPTGTPIFAQTWNLDRSRLNDRISLSQLYIQLNARL